MSNPFKQDISRRNFLIGSAGAVAGGLLFGAMPRSSWASVAAPEKTALKLGIIPLTDCAPIVVAAEKGYFAKHGLNVVVSKEASWANIRDRVALGELDGGHMLAGMPIASTVGIGGTPTPMVTAYSMDLNGNAITVSKELFERMAAADPEAVKQTPVDARALKKVIEEDKKAGKEPMTFAVVFPVSTHNYELRYWLAAGGVDPDRDLRIIVIPPPQMVANLKSNNIVGYCVGEPWNERAVEMAIGRIVATDYDIWRNNPEKVFGVTKAWADANPGTHRAVVRAMLEASIWMDEPGNREEIVQIISAKSYVNAPPEIVRMSMTGTFKYHPDEAPRSMPDFNVFHRYAATFPWLSHAEWYISQMYRWGQIEKPMNIAKLAADVYQPEIYREVAKELGVAYPTIDRKTEGTRTEPWTLTDASAPIPMGPDDFMDKRVYDPADVVAYIRGFDIHNLKVDLDALAAAQ